MAAYGPTLWWSSRPSTMTSTFWRRPSRASPTNAAETSAMSFLRTRALSAPGSTGRTPSVAPGLRSAAAGDCAGAGAGAGVGAPDSAVESAQTRDASQWACRVAATSLAKIPMA